MSTQDDTQDEGMELVMPFVVCHSKGGPYEDTAFVAGFQAGEIDHSLRTAAVTGATLVRFPIVHNKLVRQLRLIGMRHGYPQIHIWPLPGDEWCYVEFEPAAVIPPTVEEGWKG